MSKSGSINLVAEIGSLTDFARIHSMTKHIGRNTVANLVVYVSHKCPIRSPMNHVPYMSNHLITIIRSSMLFFISSSKNSSSRSFYCCSSYIRNFYVTPDTEKRNLFAIFVSTYDKHMFLFVCLSYDS